MLQNAGFGTIPWGGGGGGSEPRTGIIYVKSCHRGFLSAQDAIQWCFERHENENGEDPEWQLCKSEGLVAVPWHFQNMWNDVEVSIWKSYTFKSPGCGRQMDEMDGQIKSNATWNTFLRLLHRVRSTAMARMAAPHLKDILLVCMNLHHFYCTPPHMFRFGIVKQYVCICIIQNTNKGL